jgi:hypothetical protein
MKNYALLADDGTVVLKGAALKSRGLEPFLRDFLRDWLTLTLHGRADESPPARPPPRRDRRTPAARRRFAKTEMLTDAPATYQRKREAGGKSRQPPTKSPSPPGANSAPATRGLQRRRPQEEPPRPRPRQASPPPDPAHRDENVAYYLAKLDALAKKLMLVPRNPEPKTTNPRCF